jgi:hypothetical protein
MIRTHQIPFWSLRLGVMILAGLQMHPTAAGEEPQAGEPQAGEPKPAAAPPAVGQAPAQTEIDALIATIQERPLFTPGRRPPAPPLEEKVEPSPVVRTPPELRGRLAGVTLGLDDGRRAVFARQGEKPTVVKEGDEIDGWTVSSIEASRVVLKSSFGEKIVQPTAGAAGEGAPPETPFQRHAPPVMGVQQPQMVRPGQTGSPIFPNLANGPNPNMVRPPQPLGRNRPPAGAAARRS